MKIKTTHPPKHPPIQNTHPPKHPPIQNTHPPKHPPIQKFSHSRKPHPKHPPTHRFSTTNPKTPTHSEVFTHLSNFYHPPIQKHSPIKCFHTLTHPSNCYHPPIQLLSPTHPNVITHSPTHLQPHGGSPQGVVEQGVQAGRPLCRLYAALLGSRVRRQTGRPPQQPSQQTLWNRA